MKENFFVYILRTSGGTLYTGQTNNLEKRMNEHREKKIGAKYLKKFESFTLVYFEKYKSRSEAMKREAEIKCMTKKKKEEEIAAHSTDARNDGCCGNDVLAGKTGKKRQSVDKISRSKRKKSGGDKEERIE